METKELGLSLRLIREYDAALDTNQLSIWDVVSIWDVAMHVAMADDRDVPFHQKMADAFAFIKSRIH